MARYWLDMVNEYGFLYKKSEDEDRMDEVVWDGKLEEAGVFDNDPDYTNKLDDFFEAKFGIKPSEWEVG